MNIKDKKIITVLLIIIVLLLVCLGLIINNKDKDNSGNETFSVKTNFRYEIDFEDNKELIDKGNGVFANYQEYADYMDMNNLDKKISKQSFDKYNYIYCILSYDCGVEIYSVKDIKINNGEANVIFNGTNSCKCCNNPLLYVVAIDKDNKINTVKTSYNF